MRAVPKIIFRNKIYLKLFLTAMFLCFFFHTLHTIRIEATNNNKNNSTKNHTINFFCVYVIYTQVWLGCL